MDPNSWKRRHQNVGKIENISKESSEKILEDDPSTTETSNEQPRELSKISKILRENPNWIEDTFIEISEDESSDDESEFSENEEDETDNDKNALAPMSRWVHQILKKIELNIHNMVSQILDPF